MALDRVDAQEQLVGDLLVGRRCRIERSVLVRSAQRGEHRALRGRQTCRGGQRLANERVGFVLLRRCAEGQHRTADPDLIAVMQLDPTRHPPTVDERAVTGQSVVVDRPHAGHSLQRRVHPRDERVAVNDHVRARCPAESDNSVPQWPALLLRLCAPARQVGLRRLTAVSGHVGHPGRLSHAASHPRAQSAPPTRGRQLRARYSAPTTRSGRVTVLFRVTHHIEKAPSDSVAAPNAPAARRNVACRRTRQM